MSDFKHTVVISWTEVRERDPRHTTVTVQGTDEQVADHMRRVVYDALQYGSHVTELRVIPTKPYNVIDLDKR